MALSTARTVPVCDFGGLARGIRSSRRFVDKRSSSMASFLINFFEYVHMTDMSSKNALTDACNRSTLYISDMLSVRWTRTQLCELGGRPCELLQVGLL